MFLPRLTEWSVTVNLCVQNKCYDILSAKGFEVIFEDESFSLTEAEDLLNQSGSSAHRAEGRTDAVAASLILQQYLDRNRGEAARESMALGENRSGRAGGIRHSTIACRGVGNG